MAPIGAGERSDQRSGTRCKTRPRKPLIRTVAAAVDRVSCDRCARCPEDKKPADLIHLPYGPKVLLTSNRLSALTKWPRGPLWAMATNGLPTS